MFFFFKQKTAYELRISDWSSDVCSSDLADQVVHVAQHALAEAELERDLRPVLAPGVPEQQQQPVVEQLQEIARSGIACARAGDQPARVVVRQDAAGTDRKSVV